MNQATPSVLISIAVTALCWGVYGPLLNWGQLELQGSRLRAFLLVGIAYLVIAVMVPAVLLLFKDDGGKFTSSGIKWSFIAGATGAVGALGIILAYNFGGKPVFVMPLVFGFAPMISTLFSITTSKLWDQVGPMFFVGILTVAVGAVMVIKFAPHPAPPKKGGAKPAAAADQAGAKAGDAKSAEEKPSDEKK